MLTMTYPTDHQCSTYHDFFVKEPKPTYRKYSNKSSANFAYLKKFDFSLLQNHIINSHSPPPYNTQLVKFMLTELLQKNGDLSQISDEIHISNLTLKNCLTGKTRVLSRSSFLKILEFYITHHQTQ
jgi:hypothetical protein